ncbi:unnamed protein product [Cochlearia groenlandica]
MEGLEKIYSKFVKDAKSAASSSSSSLSDFAENIVKEKRSSGNLTSHDGSGIIVNRSSSSGISVWGCSKLCAVFFVAGVFVGFTLKRRVRRWASKLLRRIKDD